MGVRERLHNAAAAHPLRRLGLKRPATLTIELLLILLLYSGFLSRVFRPVLTAVYAIVFRGIP